MFHTFLLIVSTNRLPKWWASSLWWYNVGDLINMKTLQDNEG